MTTKVWNLMYMAGNTGHLIASAANPLRRTLALEDAAVVASNGWRCWVEHASTKKRIFESPREVAHRQAEQAKRIIEFAEAHVPGYASRTSAR